MGRRPGVSPVSWCHSTGLPGQLGAQGPGWWAQQGSDLMGTGPSQPLVLLKKSYK